jgi:hypothetical protein
MTSIFGTPGQNNYTIFTEQYRIDIDADGSVTVHQRESDEFVGAFDNLDALLNTGLGE